MAIAKSSSSFYVTTRLVSSSSDACVSTSSTSSSENSNKPLKRFNRMLHFSVARHWYQFKQASLKSQGRSVSDAGLYINNDRQLNHLDVPSAAAYRHSFSGPKANALSGLFRRSSSGGGGGAGAGAEEASDSDAERPRRSHHLRVPTPSYPGQSTGNFASGASGGGGGPRSAPATPLQLEPHHPRSHKQDKHAVKPLSGSAPSVRTATEAADSTTEGKHMSKSRQKKFQRHFPQVGPEERVLNYYSCALVGDLLLQGHLYITKNYFAFYSNVFGYVTKLLIPITSVLRITKEKVARIIPNAVGVCTRDERHVFGSLLSRDSTYKLMTHVWKAARLPDTSVAKPQVSEIELDASEYSPEDDSSSAGADQNDVEEPPVKREPEAILSTAGAAVIQPALLTGGAAPAPPRQAHSVWRLAVILLVIVLAATAAVMTYRLVRIQPQQEELIQLSGEELYSTLVRWRARAHSRAAAELHAFLNTNLLLLTKVRQSLEALSGVILTDLAQANVELPNDTAFS